jgi:hypothetical protein
MCLSGFSGATHLTWSEVDSFSRKSGFNLNSWECEQLIKMSRSYCNMLSKAKDINCPAPYQEGFDDADSLQAMRDRVNKQWDSFN